jgi:hypothetical protein
MPAPSSPLALPAGYDVPAGFEQGDVQAGDVRLHYWRHGRRTAPQLLVLHGVTDWGLDWARFARRVGDQLDCILLRISPNTATAPPRWPAMPPL